MFTDYNSVKGTLTKHIHVLDSGDNNEKCVAEKC